MLPAACAGIQVPDTARMPPFAFGVVDPDVGAIELAQWAFADPIRTRGDPVDGARAVAAVDYLAGELQASPRWQNMSVLTLMQMVQARAQVRRAVGIAPGAPSQQVVNSLIGAANALAAGLQPAALAALDNPIYQQPPPQTLFKLSNLPYVPTANVATQHAALQVFPPRDH